MRRGSSRGAHRWFQFGQSMAEYTVVMAALVGGLLVANKGACPNEYEDCIEYLLTVMHDNYDGYSSSVSAVHEYATDYEVSDSSGDWGGGSEDGGDDSGGGGGELPPSPPVTPGTAISGGDGTLYGVLDPSTGEVISDGQVVGIYDSETGTLIPTEGGGSTAVITSDVVVDEDGNILERRAIVDCGDSSKVYGFGYLSQANDNFYDPLQYNELDIGSRCTAPAYKMDGDEGGRIVDGHYYAFSTTNNVSPMPIEPTGEVVYFADEDGGACVVMVAGWDEGLTEDEDSEELYDAQIDLWKNTPAADNPTLGEQDDEYYALQVLGNGEDPSPNGCAANRVISQP